MSRRQEMRNLVIPREVGYRLGIYIAMPVCHELGAVSNEFSLSAPPDILREALSFPRELPEALSSPPDMPHEQARYYIHEYCTTSA